jgi:hypothetical protein
MGYPRSEPDTVCRWIQKHAIWQLCLKEKCEKFRKLCKKETPSLCRPPLRAEGFQNESWTLTLRAPNRSGSMFLRY